MGKPLLQSESLKEKPLDVGRDQRREHWRVWLRKRFGSHVGDLIFSNHYEGAWPGFEQPWGRGFMTWSEIIGYGNYSSLCKGFEQAYQLFIITKQGISEWVGNRHKYMSYTGYVTQIRYTFIYIYICA